MFLLLTPLRLSQHPAIQAHYSNSCKKWATWYPYVIRGLMILRGGVTRLPRVRALSPVSPPAVVRERGGGAGWGSGVGLSPAPDAPVPYRPVGALFTRARASPILVPSPETAGAGGGTGQLSSVYGDELARQREDA